MNKLFDLASPRRQSQLQFVASTFLVASLFAVPLSESFKAICLGLALFCMVLTTSSRRDLGALLVKPWCQATILLFAVVLLSCFWSPATLHQKTAVVNKYSKCLLLPFLVVGFRDPKVRRFGLYAYLLAMFITCVMSMLKASGTLDFNGEDPGKVVHNHIMTGFMMSFAAYLSAWLTIRQKGIERILMTILFLLFTYQLFFINTGRTGYLIDAILMFLLMLQFLSWRWVVMGGMLGLVLLGGIYHQSNTMKQAVKMAVDDLKGYREGDLNTSLGYRLQFHTFSKELFLRHPWIGNGSGSYTYYFRKEDPVPAWQVPPLVSVPKKMVEPHSQYWLVAAETGILGLTALFVFFGSLLYAGLQLPVMRSVAIALILSFMVGNLSDSLLYYSGTGTFFLLFMAMCLGEGRSLPDRHRFHGNL
ncbi:MAG: O-antigen ligase family protein [Legionellales bacterium]|nr:O-antigen ligase family protein [Legionellales bacterium]